MKKIILLFLAVTTFGLTNCFSQTVNNVPIKDIDVSYIQIVGQSKAFSSKLNIQIDFGQENKLFNQKDTQLRDENGKQVTFNSMIDALNFMSKTGYEFVDAYTVTMGNQNVYHYLMKKKTE